MIVDSHVHFWDPARGDDILVLKREPSLRRRFSPADLEPLLRQAGAERCVVVQSAPEVGESRYLMELAGGLGWVHGVVGWVDLEAPDVHGALRALSRLGPLVGVRAMLHRQADASWIACPTVRPGLRALADADLSLDLIAEPRHLPAVREALLAVPELRVVVDHGATPPIAAQSLEPWATSLDRLARETGAWCKFSGLREAAGTDPSVARLLPYAERMLAAFGPQRLLYASNWPVCNLAGGYAAWWSDCRDLLDRLGVLAVDKAAIFGGNARRAYRRNRL